MWAEYKSTLKVSLCFLFLKFYNDTEDKVKFWITKFGEFGHLCFKILWLDFFLLENSWYNLFALCIYTNFHSNQNWLNFSRVKINIQTFVQLLQFTIKAIFLCIYEERESFNTDIFSIYKIESYFHYLIYCHTFKNCSNDSLQHYLFIP